MDVQEYRRRIRRVKLSSDELIRYRRRCMAAMTVCVSASVIFTACCLFPSTRAYARQSLGDMGCSASMRWPVDHALIVGRYDVQDKRWLPGHRGVDLRTRSHETIIAPADGVIAFSGKVSGKSVVTIRHGAKPGSLTSTFEPAVTLRAVGTGVSKGERFAQVEGDSDHCADQCLHWGLKTETRDYMDPSDKVRSTRIGLKPTV